MPEPVPASTHGKPLGPNRREDAPHSKALRAKLFFASALGARTRPRVALAVLRCSFSAQHFQQCERILRRSAFGVVIEINVHVAIFVQPTADARRPFLESGVAIAGSVFACVPVQPNVNDVGRHTVPHRPGRRVGHADGSGMLRQAFRNFIIEPGFVTKLDCVPRTFPMPQRL